MRGKVSGSNSEPRAAMIIKEVDNLAKGVKLALSNRVAQRPQHVAENREAVGSSASRASRARATYSF